MIYWKEFPELSIPMKYLHELATTVETNNSWRSIRKVKQSGEIDFELHPLQVTQYTDRSQLRAYTAITIHAYVLNTTEIVQAGLKCKFAALFKTQPGITTMIHREIRHKSLNFPIVFEPNQSSVKFYDDLGTQVDEHILTYPVPVFFNVEQWHAVHNTSTSPRIVAVCSEFTDEWSEL